MGFGVRAEQMRPEDLLAAADQAINDGKDTYAIALAVTGLLALALRQDQK